MNRAKCCAACCLLMLLACGLPACNLTRPYPTKALFALEVGKPPAAAARESGVVLRIYDFIIASPYDGQSFVYKTGPTRFENDYYNGFIADPSHLLTAATVDWMREGGRFPVVPSTSGSVANQLFLEGNVREMYGDYTDKSCPRAVMTVAFFLMDNREVNGRVLFQRMYHVETPVGGSGPDEFSAALSRTYRKILLELTSDMQNVDVPPATQTAEDK